MSIYNPVGYDRPKRLLTYKNPARLYALYLYTFALSRRDHYTTFGKFSLLILAITDLVY